MTSLSFQDILNTDINFGNTLTTSNILMTLFITFLTAMFIYYIYKKTYAGVLYSKEFNVTLVIVSMVVSVVMMGISRSLTLSLGMVGALSIVRFRSAIKDPRDITFLFWAISVGIINGINLHKLAIISSIATGLVIVLLSRKSYFSHPYMLVVRYNKLDDDTLEQVLKNNSKKHKVRNISFTKDYNERIVELKLVEKQKEVLMKKLKSLKGIESLNLFSYTGELHD